VLKVITRALLVLALAIASATRMQTGLSSGFIGAADAETVTCDYSFIVHQPIFNLVAPQESSADVSLATPLGVESDGNFGIVRQVELVPDTGKPLLLAPKFAPYTPPSQLYRNRNFASSSSVIETMAIPRLRPSTTYDVVLSVSTQAAPAGCPKTLTEHIARFTTESPTSLDAIALSHEPASPPRGVPTGPQIFDNALHVLRTFEYPPAVSFIVTTRSTIGGKAFVEEYRSSLRTSDGIVITHSIPIYTTNLPENPWGWRVNIPILSSLFPSQRKGNFSQPFGVPEISPAYAFGLEAPKPVAFPGMRQSESNEDDSIKTLGRVLTIARDYDATLIDVEPYHDRYVYHLKLTPIDRPDQYRLREAWVDTQAFVIWKLRSAGIFDDGPATTVPWDAEYTVVDGHWFMSTEYTTSTIRTGGFLQNSPPVNYDGVSFTFSDFEYPVDTLDLDFFSEVKTQAMQY
jgi:hypothetical protein